MLSVRELATSLYGAYRLARFDPSGLRFFDASPAGAGRSFYAAAIVAPLYGLMLAVASPERDVSYLRFGFIEGTAYVLSWVAYQSLLNGLLVFSAAASASRAIWRLTIGRWCCRTPPSSRSRCWWGSGLSPWRLDSCCGSAFSWRSYSTSASSLVCPGSILVTAAGLVVLDVLLRALIDGSPPGCIEAAAFRFKGGSVARSSWRRTPRRRIPFA